MRSPDLEALVGCIERVALLLGVQAPSDERCRAVLEYVLFERGALEADRLGIITADEAVFLVMAHVQSKLFRETMTDEHEMVWNDPALISEFRRGLDA